MDDQVTGGSAHKTAADSTERIFSPKLTPREIQQRIRNGESIESLAHQAGTTIEYVARFAAPIQDEMNHLMGIALSTPVITAKQESSTPQTFSEVLEDRIRIVYDSEPVWSIWKDLITGKWVLQLRFVADGEQLDARWHYEQRRMYLTPENRVAVNLSKISTEPEETDATYSEESVENVTRFDSAAFKPDITQFDTMEFKEPIAYGRSDQSEAVITELYGKNQSEKTSGSSALSDQETTPGPREFGVKEPDHPLSVANQDELEQTEELLDELNQRRGKRIKQENFLSIEEYQDIDIELDGFSDSFEDNDKTNPGQNTTTSNATQQTAEIKPEDHPNTAPKRRESSGRKGRQQIPSWDEIVFGAKPEDL